jgi:hypothetical protein
MLSLLTRLLLLAFCTLVPAFGLWAQDFPLDPASGKIFYAEEVLVMDGPKTDLFHRARTWLLAANTKRQALQVADASNGVLIARTYSVLPAPKGTSRQACKLWHTIKIEVEDDRYWYSLSGFQLQWEPAGAASEEVKTRPFPLEDLVLAKASPAKKKPLTSAEKLLAAKARERIATLIEDLKANML